MGSETLTLEGFEDFEAALDEIASVPTRRGIGRRALRRAALPLAVQLEAAAPRRSGALAESVAVSTKLSKRQAKLHRKEHRGDPAHVEVFVGAGPLSQAHTEEFGTLFQPARPWARPVWDADHRALLDRLRVALWDELQKSLRRAEARARRVAERGL